VKLCVFTLGFTAEFIVKPLLEAGVDGTYILILYVNPEDKYSRKRVEEALRYVEDLAKKGGFIERLEKFSVNLSSDFTSIVYNIATIITNEIRKKEIKYIYAYLTGGMRVLVIATMIAIKLITEALNTPTTFHVWSEDGVHRYTFDLSVASTNVKNISKAKMEVLRKIVALNGASYHELTNEKRTNATVRKIVELLRKNNLVVCERRGKRTFCKPTEIGKLLVKVSELIGA